MNKQLKYSFLIASLMFFSCEKEEQPIKPTPREEAKVISISTGANGDYSKQIFFNLNRGEVVKTVDRTSWDLGFESTANGVNIILNSSNGMRAARTPYSDFYGFTSLQGMTLDYKWDHSSGLEDSLALKDWLSNGLPTNKVFVVDRGENPDASGRGLKKLQILSSNSTEYTIKFANVNGTEENTFTVTKDAAKNNTCFSFDNGGSIVDIEPNKNDWDLLFTQYTHTFYVSNPPTPYSVNGVLINKEICTGAKVFDKGFNDIKLEDIATYNLTNTQDVIGYDWKYYDFDAAQYTVSNTQNYLLKGSLGEYYKLRFVDFYNDQGIKGAPKFELEKLN